MSRLVRRIALLLATLLLGWGPLSGGAAPRGASLVEFFPDGGFEVGNLDLEISRTPRYGVVAPGPPALENSIPLAGARSLRLHALTGGRYRLVTRALGLVPGERYDFSLIVGAEKTSRIRVEVFGAARGPGGKKIAGTTRRLGNGVSRIALSFRARKGFSRYWCRVFLSGRGDFLLDELSLKGPGPDGLPVKRASLGLSPVNPLGVFRAGEPGTMLVRTPPGSAGLVSYDIVDRVTGSRLGNGRTVRVGAKGEAQLVLATERRGSFVVNARFIPASGGPEAAGSRPYAVIRPDPVNGPRDSRFGLCMEEHGLATFIDAHYTPESLYRLAGDLGAGSVRIFSLARPGLLSDDGSTYDFKELDRALSLADRFDLEVMIPLGSNRPNNVPGWLRTPRPEGNVDLVSGLRTKRLMKLVRQDAAGYLDMAAYESFLENLLAHLRGKVDYFEIWNEPGHKFSVADTVQLAAVTWRARSRVNPEAVILGPSSSKGRGVGQGTDPARDPEFLREFMAAGGGRYLDVLSFHSGHAFRFMGDRFDLRNQETGYVPRLRRILGRYGKTTMDIWDTERGIPWRSMNSDSGQGDVPLDHGGGAANDIDLKSGQGQLEVARQLPMVFAADFAEGVERMFWFYLDSGHPSIHSPDLRWGMFDLYNEPTPMLAVYDAMTEILAGAVFHSRVERRDGTRVYLFRRGGDTVLLAYNWREKVTSFAVSSEGAESELFDIMGNPVAVPVSSPDVEVDGWPRYILIKGRVPERVKLR
ncbi:MAG: hypothetical protein L3J03_08145 [Desulfobacterales bacterium]|nr:hypothetical protein [Desulfobacterales bacterium]